MSNAAHSIKNFLENILIPRAVDSEGSKIVRKFISTFLSDLGWFVELDSFAAETVDGPHNFSNIIARLHPERPRQFILGKI
jgi:hypothetical protein